MKTGREWRRARKAGLALAAAALAAAAARSVRLAVAEGLFFTGRAEAVRRAAALEPRRALYHLAAAEAEILAGKDPRGRLRAAVRASPYDASLRVRLGLEAEARGDLAEAQAELLAAAARSRKHLPRWTLAGYFFRRGDQKRFWPWAGAAFAVAPGSPEALFDLCWKMEPDAAAILERALPERPGVRVAFAEFLLRRGEWAQLAKVAPRLLESPQPNQVPRLLGLVDGLAAHGEIPAAVEIWNGLCRRGWLPWDEKEAGAAQWLTNPEFTGFPAGRGFDWRLNEAPGVSFRPARGGGLRIELSGRQPEQAWLLRQPAPALSAGTARLECDYEVRVEPGAARGRSTGLRWRVWSGAPGGTLLGELPLPGAGGRVSVPLLVTAAGGRLTVELIHRREPGSPRLRGRLTLRRVTLELQEARDEP